VGSSNHHRVAILNVPVDAFTEREIERWIAVEITGNGPARHIVTYNPEYAIAARRDPAFQEALRRAELVTADGVGITLAAKLHRRATPLERITGVRLLGLLAATGEPLFLLGAAPGVAEQASAKLRAAHPEANIAGWWWDGTPNEADDAEAIRRIAESGARIVAVAYGAPGQIHWIERNRRALSEHGVRIAIGIGGALDYWAGTATLPPAFVRRLGVEWLYRLIREPWRWRRQLVLPWFALLAGWEALRTWLPGGDRNRVS
jgi:N-acetylglucosaminyldiphosphoundecaprenol N-acetyl-beta-D-mannosaminyltransferase